MSLRNEEIYRRHMEGETFSTLADEFGISVTRAQQIFHKRALWHVWTPEDQYHEIRRERLMTWLHQGYGRRPLDVPL